MKKFLTSLIVAVLAVRSQGGCSMVDADELTAGQNPEQQATPQGQMAAEQPATPPQQVVPEQHAAAEKRGYPVW